MWDSRRYFLRSQYEQRTTVLHQYIMQTDAFRMRPAFEASLRHAKEQAERAAEAAAEAMEKANASSRAKSEFLANMSHELRTPLNAIIGFADVIRGQTIGLDRPDKYLEYAEDIRNSGQHLLDVINDILDLAKIEYGKSTLVEEEADLEDVVRACFRIVHEKAVENDLELVAASVPERTILHADIRKIKQILLNLLSNATKFTPRGGRIAFAARRTGDDGIALRVEDSGIGIAPADIDKALAPFMQIDSRLSRKYQGTGLGLPLTKALAELHGGSLDIVSELGKGTAVTVTLPARRVTWRTPQ